jgi:hypothetical protein
MAFPEAIVSQVEIRAICPLGIRGKVTPMFVDDNVRKCVLFLGTKESP